MGAYALLGNTTGVNNVAIGTASLKCNTTGVYNVAIGVRALYALNGGTRNVSVGIDSLRFNTTGNQNVALGSIALFCNVGGNYNVGLGRGALRGNTTGLCNIGVGKYANCALSTGVNNTIAVGHNSATSETTGHTVWGNSGNNLCNCVYKAWELASDCRDKANIQTLPTKLGLQFINKLRPVSFNWDYRDTYVRECKYSYGEKDGSFISEKKSYGVIAQELKQVLEDLQVDFDGLGHDAEKDAYRIGYEELIAPIIKSIQELVAENQEIKDRLTTLENK
jgi:hypothetical protein